MNHAPSDPTFDEPANSHHNSSNHDSASHSPQGAAAAMSTLSGDSERQRKEIYKKYKIQFLDNLIRQLDVVIYCELSILYYMEYASFPPSTLPHRRLPYANVGIVPAAHYSLSSPARSITGSTSPPNRPSCPPSLPGTARTSS